MREEEQTANTAARRSKREHPDVRLRERTGDTAARRSKREDRQVRLREQTGDTVARRSKREDRQVRLREQTGDTAARRSKRENPQVRLCEQTANTRRRKMIRHDGGIRGQNSAVLRCLSTEELIQSFHSLVSNGPVYICSCCDQLLFKHSVQSAINLRSKELPNSNSFLLGLNENSTGCIPASAFKPFLVTSTLPICPQPPHLVSVCASQFSIQPVS